MRLLWPMVGALVGAGLLFSGWLSGVKSSTRQTEQAVLSLLRQHGVGIGPLSDGSPTIELTNGPSGQTALLTCSGLYFNDSHGRVEISLEAQGDGAVLSLKRYVDGQEQPSAINIALDRYGFARIGSNHGGAGSPGFLVESLAHGGSGLYVWDSASPDAATPQNQASIEVGPSQPAGVIVQKAGKPTARWP